MKINKHVFFLVFSLFVLGFSFGVPAVQAASSMEYPLLEKIPGTNNVRGSDLPGYISAIYKVALIVVTLSAVLMLSIGGFMYLTSAGNTASMGTAKGIIYDSLIGLVIALSAWLVLYIINPDLVKISLQELPPLDVTNSPAPSSSPLSLPSGSDSDLAKRILVHPDITMPWGGDCKSSSGTVSPASNIKSIADGKRADKCTSDCKTVPGGIGCFTEATQLSHTMLAAMIAVADIMPYTVTSISGGPHAGNSAHYQGKAIDIVPVSQALMDAFVRAGAIAPNGNAASMCESPAGQNVGCAPGSGANHIHLIFPS